MNVFRSAILDSDGHTVNVGYLSLFWIMIVVLNVVPFMCGLAAWSVYQDAKTTVEVIKALGMGVGAVAGGFSTTLAALGLFLWGDSKAGRSAPQPVQTSSNLPDGSTNP